MSKITLPPLPKPRRLPCHGVLTVGGYTAEQMQERDRQVVEHVIRACAQRIDEQIAKGLHPATHAAAILDLLEGLQ